LNQTHSNLEVFVVIDGPDAATERALSAVEDNRLHVLALERNVGGSEARNLGARAASGKWVAMLDDDDEWLSTKLERQLYWAEQMKGTHLLISCKFIERTESSERVLPTRLPDTGEHCSDYLFNRRGLSSAEGFLQTSTWLISRQLILDVPFTKGLKRCQDPDWLLHATALPQTEVFVVPEVLAIFNHDERAGRVSRTPDWKFLYDWCVGNRQYFTPRAFSFFIAAYCIPAAEKQKAGLRVFFRLLTTCVRRGSPSAKCLMLFFLFWFIPEGSRRKFRDWGKKAQVAGVTATS
jgi:glycosyltransferase involved in cell wall biosynthesis